MEKFIKLKCEISINENSGRKSIISGYRPAFKLVEKSDTSGSIHLLDRQVLYLGDKALAEIRFIPSELLKVFEKGMKFCFYEGNTEIGEVRVIET